MKYRHEWKHEISSLDCMILRSRLSVVMKHDPHAINGKYKIRSLYFDTPEDKALREKIDGVNIRDKYRIRYYNNDTSVIFLEKKSKINGLCAKNSCLISKEEARAIVDGNIDTLSAKDRPLINELCFKMKAERLQPKTIVDYTREPFVYLPGNVRVTMDYDIRTGMFRTDF